MMFEKLKRLLLSLVLCHGAGFIGATTTIGEWSESLVKPAFYPPGYIFAPVWLVLYTLMAVSLYLVWSHTKERNIFIIHLIFNAAWSIIFFGYHLIFWALIDLVIIWLFVIYLIFRFYKIRKNAGILLFPYLLWLTFAGILNYFILILN